MENTEEQLRKNVEVVIKWLKKYRPTMSGLGGPIMLLQQALTDIDLEKEIDLTREIKVKEPEVIDKIVFQTSGDLKKFLENV